MPIGTVRETNYFRGGVFAVLTISIIFNSSVAVLKERNIMSYSNSKQVIEFLTDKGITNGYASFWNANINIFYSDGTILISPVNSFRTLELQQHISSTGHYEYNQSVDQYFIWLTKEEEEKHGNSILNVVERYEFGDVIIYICDRSHK